MVCAGLGAVLTGREEGYAELGIEEMLVAGHINKRVVESSKALFVD